MNEELQHAMGRIELVRKTLLTLEWDLKQNQLNSGKKAYYDELKKEYEDLDSKIRKFKADGAIIENEGD